MAAQAASGGMGVAIRVTIKARSVIPYIIDTTPDDGSSVATAAPVLQVFFDQDMDTSRQDTSRVLLPAGMAITSLVWSDARTLNIHYTGSLSSYGAKRVDLADGYFVSTVGQPIPVGGGFAFYYANPNSPPNPPVISITAGSVGAGQTVQFNAVASDPNGDPVTVTWDFGDGTTGVGPSPSHTYATGGPFLVTATAEDGRGGTATMSMFLGGAGALPPAAGNTWVVTKAQVGLGFKKAGNDKITVGGVVELSAGFDPSGKSASVSFGGAAQSFTLTAKGTAKQGKDQFKLTRKLDKKVFRGGAVKIQFTLKGAFVTLLADEGLTNETTPKTGKTVSVPVLLQLGGTVYQADVPMMVWKAKAGTSGKGTWQTAVR
ncbi:MAG: PKD domain-containing protein [Planctomycetota bacterium]|nr:PKD domain-containing protein [Planctomycetota bacterium]